MKNKLFKSGASLLMLFMALNLFGQTIKEGVGPLSNKAQKGFLLTDGTTFDKNGNINALYKIKDKKKDEVSYELYSFDKDLKFLEGKSVKEPKVETKPDKTVKYLGAWVGGSTSFDVLSMKLKVGFKEENQKWDYKNQMYVRKNLISSETIKLKTESGKNYIGVAEFRNEETSNLTVLAYFETGDKKNPNQYVILNIDYDGGVKEKNIDVTGAYSMVFCQAITEEAPGKSVGKQDFVVVLAPKSGNGDATKYVYLHYDIKGTLKNKVEFTSPSSNLLVNSVDVKNGEVFMSALSTKSKDAYEEIFKDYSSIGNPGADDDGNFQLAKYNKAASEEMDFLHLLKFSGNKMIFATTAPISDFKAKKQIAVGEKSGKVYNGKKFFVQNFEVTPNNEFLVSGQTTFMQTINNVPVKGYGDIICFHFDSQGQIKAQYAVDKLYEDKASETSSMPQTFFVTGDGKSAYWEILEFKMGTNLGGNKYYPHYFPRIVKVDLAKATLGEFKYPGNKQYYVYHDEDNGSIVMYFDANTATRTYMGVGLKGEEVWVSKVTFD